MGRYGWQKDDQRTNPRVRRGACGERAMSVQALAWAIEQPLPGEAKLVLMALANHADHTTGECRFNPSIIAREASVPETSLPRYIGALRRNGYVARDDKGKERHYWLQFARDMTIDWSWQAAEPEGDEEGPNARAPDIAPIAFQPTRQVEQREKAVAPPPGQPPGQVPVIEGSRAFEAWHLYYRRQRRLTPFSRYIIVDGKTRRGFYMPTLFPPSEVVEDGIN